MTKPIITALGWPEDNVEPTLTAARLAQCQAVLSVLASLDTAIGSAVLDSMAQQVGSIKVDYTAHLAQLKAEGSRQLALLSSLSDTPIYFDKYAGRRPSQPGQASHPLSVQRYW